MFLIKQKNENKLENVIANELSKDTYLKKTDQNSSKAKMQLEPILMSTSIKNDLSDKYSNKTSNSQKNKKYRT